MELPTFRRRCVRAWVWKDNLRCGRRTARLPTCLRSLLLTHAMPCSTRPHRKDKVWSVRVWYTLFAMTVGVHIPVIAAICLWLQKFARHALGDLRALPIRLPTGSLQCCCCLHLWPSSPQQWPCTPFICAGSLKTDHLQVCWFGWSPCAIQPVPLPANEVLLTRQIEGRQHSRQVSPLLSHTYTLNPLACQSVVVPVPHANQYHRRSESSVVPISQIFELQNRI